MSENYISEQANARENNQYPFSVPEHVRSELATKTRWQWWVKHYPAPTPYESMGLNLMAIWHNILEDQLAALDSLIQPSATNAYGDPESQAYGVLHGLSLMVEDFRDLWAFTSETMPYDPGVQYRMTQSCASSTSVDTHEQARPINMTDGFPYPIPEDVAKRFDAARFGRMWRAYALRYEQYLDPETGESRWDEPFSLGILERWSWAFVPLWEQLHALLLEGDIETRFSIVAMERLIDDLEILLPFSVDTWKYDPMIRTAFDPAVRSMMDHDHN